MNIKIRGFPWCVYWEMARYPAGDPRNGWDDTRAARLFHEHTPDEYGLEWAWFHQFSFTYPDVFQAEDSARLQLDLNSFTGMIACSLCRTHFSEFRAQHPESAIRTRQALEQWGVAAHNEVNLRNGKPAFTYQQFLEQPLARVYYSKHKLASPGTRVAHEILKDVLLAGAGIGIAWAFSG